MINQPDVFNIPEPEKVAIVFWLKADFPKRIINDAINSILQKDATADVIGIQFRGDPDIETKVRADGAIVSQKVNFPLQLLVIHGGHQHWRYNTLFTYRAKGLMKDNPVTTLEVIVTNSERLYSEE